MRINRVKHALKKGLVCGKCNKTIVHSHDDKKTKKRVLGDPYIWIKHRYGGKRIRCTAQGCGFTSADMTTSEKLGRVYDARDSARDAVSEWDGEDIEDLKTSLSELADAIREVADEYNESADNIEQAFPSGCPKSEECRERADELSSWIDEIESADFEELEEDGDKEEWIETQRENALGVVDACPV